MFLLPFFNLFLLSHSLFDEWTYESIRIAHTQTAFPTILIKFHWNNCDRFETYCVDVKITVRCDTSSSTSNSSMITASDITTHTANCRDDISVWYSKGCSAYCTSDICWKAGAIISTIDYVHFLNSANATEKNVYSKHEFYIFNLEVFFRNLIIPVWMIFSSIQTGTPAQLQPDVCRISFHDR